MSHTYITREHMDVAQAVRLLELAGCKTGVDVEGDLWARDPEGNTLWLWSAMTQTPRVRRVLGKGFGDDVGFMAVEILGMASEHLTDEFKRLGGSTA
jgi:hypothetical protein